MTMLDDFKLTDAEIDYSRRTDALRHDYSINTRAIADAATAKALRGVVVWMRTGSGLGAMRRDRMEIADCLEAMLAEEQGRG